ncbi:MAG: hypothetical protein IT232_00290, partial [Flavobacteriales bacterium]|nr:hypothetical protein [Flavobacteriales bacterium]
MVWPTIGSSWDYGLVVADTSGNTGGTGTCGTTVTRTNSVPTITTGTATVTSANLTTNTTYASATNTTETMSHNAICSTSVGSSVTPTINTTPPTCSSPSVSTITNYDASSNYVFTPSGPTVGAGGVISGMVDGTSYTVSASNSLCSNSSPSASFSNAPMLSVPNTPAITTTPVSCNTSSTSTITNFDSTLTYVFTPAGPTVGVGGVINGAVDGTTYSVTAGNGSCSSQASTFTNSSSSPITVTVSSNSVCVNGTLTLTPTTGGTWVSNNPSVATVTSGGVVSIVSNGSVDFTFTDLNSCTATTSVVTVNPSEDASFSYPSGSYCLTDANPTPTITGTSGGTFTINNSGV